MWNLLLNVLLDFSIWFWFLYLYLFFTFQIFSVSLKMRILRVLQEFSHSTSIHGFCYLVRPNGTTRSKIGFALCILAGLIYASLELRITVFCKFIDEESCKIVFMNNTGTPLIGQILGPRKNSLNRNPSY